MLRLVLSGLIALKSAVVNLGHLEALNLIELNVYRKREREQNVSTTEENLVKHLDEVNKVVEEYLKGNDPTKISKELALPRTKVVALIEEWRQMAADNAAIRARAKEALVGADTHYNKLIAKAYEVIDDATTTANLGAKNGAIKLVMDIEKTRIDMLQKAGLLENQELAEEMIEIEEKQQILVSILRDVASEHPEIRDKIMSRLSQFARKGEVITVVHNNV
jgi:translation initiation factor 2B subunit (eIF-2B alpha/beta/delta family)